MRRNVVVAAAIVLALAVIVLFALNPFSDDEGAALADVSVTEGEEPELEIDSAIEVEEPVVRVVEEGDGRELAEGDYFRAGYLIGDGADGELLDSSYAGGAEQAFQLVPPQEATQPQVFPGLPELMIKELVGTPIGSKVLVAATAGDFFGESITNTQFKPEQTLVFYFDITDGTRVSDTEVPSGDAQALPAGIPTPVVDGENVTGIDGSAAAPTPTASVNVLIEGDGEEVTADQAVVADYLGTVYPNGEIFDESFSKEDPAVFSLSGVIPCWTEQLAGQKVGSRVVLTCPTETAYGDSPQPGGVIQPGDALTFVIDIRDAF